MIFLFLIGACETEKDIDHLIKDYIKDKYNFDIDFVSKESINENNFGDRTYVVKSKNEPRIEFNVYLTGMIGSEIERDDYEEQHQAYEWSQLYTSENASLLKEYGYEQLLFKSSHYGIEISFLAKTEISLLKKEEVERLLTFVTSLNSFNRKNMKKNSFSNISINNPNEHTPFIFIDDPQTIVDMNSLIHKLRLNTGLANEEMIQKDYDKFLAFEAELNNVGYMYQYGSLSGNFEKSIYCDSSRLSNGECIGGYSVRLDGSRSESKLYQLIEMINSQQTIDIYSIALVGSPYVEIENVSQIKSLEDFRTVLEDRSKY